MFKQLNQLKENTFNKTNSHTIILSKTNYLLSSILFFVLIAFTTSKVNAQTYLIDPTVSTLTTNIANIGNGSFEAISTNTTASTYAAFSYTANGWTVTNTTGLFWNINTQPGASSNGTRSAYVGNSTGNTATWIYNTSTSYRSVYFYRDVIIPVGTNSLNLAFQWKGHGNGTTDKATVYLVPVSYTPVAHNSVVLANYTASLPSAIYNPLWSSPAAVSPTVTPAWTSTTMSIPTASFVAGSTYKLIFCWQQDIINTIPTNQVSNIPIAIDAVDLTYFTTGCSGAPAPATASISSTNGCSSSTFTLNASGASALSGITHQWQSSTDGGVTWANTGVSSTTYTNTASVTTSYQYVSTCSAASASVASTAVTYSVNTCAVTIDMLDVGNGWNGASVDLVINGSTFLNCGSTFTAGVSQTISACVPANSSYSLVCISAGSAPVEPGIKLTINSVLQYSIAANANLMTTGATLMTGYACQVFTATPSCVPTASISPTNGQASVALSQVLTWPAMPQAGSYDVYFGTNNPPTNIANGVNQIGTTYSPVGGLLANTQYYWRVVPKNGSYAAPTCATVFSFNTGIAGCGAANLFLTNPTYNCNGSQYVYSTCTFFGEYNILNNMVPGAYTFGANTSAFITIKSSTGIILAAGAAPLVYTFTTSPSASYQIQLNAPANCGTDFSCHSVWVQCGAPPIAAPTSISSSTTAVCAGGAVTFTANGTPPASSNVYWFTGSCGTNTAAAIATGSIITVNPMVSATYYANNFNGTAWSSCVTQFITVSASPALTVSSNATICPGSISTLTASANSLGILINDNCAQTATTTITAGTPGTVQGTLTGVYPDIVSVSNTTNAGGTAGEANLAGWSFSNTTDRLTYGPISTVGNTSLTLTWSNYLRHFSSTYAYGVTVQTSTNNATWNNTSWGFAPITASIPVGTESVVVSTADVGSPTFYLSFRLFGATYGIWNWYIDNVLLTGASAASPVTWTPITGLYTDVIATAAYASTATNTVYSKPVANVTYSAMATGANGCVTTSSVSVSLQVPNISPAPVAGDFIWGGRIDNNWANANNWYQTNGTYMSLANAVPAATNNAIVAPTGSCITQQPTVASFGSGLAKNLSINAGAILTLAANSAVTASNVTIASTASISMNPSTSSTLNVAGNWTNNGIFDEGFSAVNFNGATAQTINTSSTSETFYNVALNNSNGGVTLNKTTEVINNMNLTSGKLTSSATNLLIFKDNATASNASNSSFVSGPVRKIGDDPFIFPVGKVGDYAPIAITAPSLVTDHFTAEYFLTDPNPLYNRSLKDAGLSNISACEYWILDRTNGSSSVNVKLSWNTPRSCGVGILSDLRVARWDGSTWRDESIGALIGNTTTGTIETPGVVANFSPFALASRLLASNSLGTTVPLPIELTKFDATCEDEKIHITWSTATETNNDYYTIERSGDGVSFDVIALVDAKGNANAAANYSIQDGNPINGLSYYRLTQTDFDKNSKTYNIVGVSCSSKNSSVVVYPNPNNGSFTIQGLEIGAELLVTDVLGKIIYKATTSDIKTQLNLGHLSKGIYYLKTNNDLNDSDFKKIIIN